MPTLEKDIERKVARWAKRHKDVMLYWKLTVPGLSGVPDRILLLRGGTVAFIEYKRPGARPRKLQELLHRKLQEFGFNVAVHDDADEAIEFIEGLINELKS